MIKPAYTKYESYKEVDDLTKIPSHWSIRRIKEVGSVRGRVGWKALKASEYVDEGYIFLSTPNIKNKEIDFLNVNYITRERYIESPEIMLKEGDILLAKDGSTLGTVNIVASLLREATVNSSIGVIRLGKQIFNRYVYYQIRSEYIQNKINLKKSGMGVPHLFQQDINNFVILLPTFQEQQAIAHYLDAKTAQIDRKIELLEKKAQKYSDLKQSLINETVTRGLDKTVPMKDSGVEWIGQIPAHWEMKRLKDIANIQNSNVDKKSYEHEIPVRLCNYVDVYKNEYIDSSLDFMRATAGESEIRRFSIKKNDVLLTKDSETFDDIAVPALVVETLKDVICGYHLAQIRTKEKILSGAYLFRLFQSQRYGYRFTVNAKGITRVGLGQPAINDALTPIPPLPEQEAIVQYLKSKTSQIDHIIDAINLKIEKLKELRKTLINDVVTGRIKVI